jgi:hypothetical protein
MELSATIVSICGIGLSLAGALVLVREVRYAQLGEYHNLNLDEVLRKADEFRRDPALYIKKSVYETYGERVVNAFGVISDEQWKKADPDHVRRLEESFREGVARAKEWKQRVPFRTLQRRMRWLTTGAVLLSGGAVLQIAAAAIQSAAR